MKLFASAVGMAMMLSGCGSGMPITAKEIAGEIMPNAADAPAGTQIDVATVGPKGLTEFVTDSAVRVRLAQLRFRVAYVASFATPNYVADKARAPLGSAFYGTFAILLETVENAERGYRFYRDRLKGRAKGFTPFAIPTQFGDESFAFRFSELDDTPLPGFALLFREENALFSVVGVGNPSPDPAVPRALATKIAVGAKDAA